MSWDVLLKLFISFFRIGLFAIGGGYATMPLIRAEVVDLHAWLTVQEFNDLITISQMTPGPIAVNSASFVGTVIAGPVGAIVATIACILPACIILSILAYVFFKYQDLAFIQGLLAGLRPLVVALILSAGVSIALNAFFGADSLQNVTLSAFKIKQGIFFLISFYLLRRKKKDPILVMLLSGVFAGLCHMLGL